MKTNKRLLKVLIVFSALIFSVSMVHADIREVPGEYATISAALSAPAVAGDIISVAVGTHDTEPGNVITMVEGVDIVGENQDTTIINAEIIGASNTRLNNLTIEVDYSVISPAGNALFSASGKGNITIRGCKFIAKDIPDAAYYGISLGSVTSAEIDNNSVYIKGDRDDDIFTGIYFSGTDTWCTNNNVYVENASLASTVLNVTGIHYDGNSHVILNNAVETRSESTVTALALKGENEGTIETNYSWSNYNLLKGDIESSLPVNIGSLKGVDPYYEKTGLPLEVTTAVETQDASPTKAAAEPGSIYPDIGVSDSIVRDGSYIQEAIDAAPTVAEAPYPVVLIPPGVYNLTGTSPDFANSALIINKNIILKSSSGNPADTIIDIGRYRIDIIDPTVYPLGMREPYRYKNAESDSIEYVTIEGFTMRGCYSSRYSFKRQGAYGLYTVSNINGRCPINNYAETLIIKDCIISNNKGRKASAFYSWGDTHVRLENTQVINNVSEYQPYESWYPSCIYMGNFATITLVESAGTIVPDVGEPNENINANPPGSRLYNQYTKIRMRGGVPIIE